MTLLTCGILDLCLPALTTKVGRAGGWFACSSAASIALIAAKINKARHKTVSRPKQTFLQRTQMTSKHGKMLNVVRGVSSLAYAKSVPRRKPMHRNVSLP